MPCPVTCLPNWASLECFRAHRDHRAPGTWLLLLILWLFWEHFFSSFWDKIAYHPHYPFLSILDFSSLWFDSLLSFCHPCDTGLGGFMGRRCFHSECTWWLYSVSLIAPLKTQSSLQGAIWKDLCIHRKDNAYHTTHSRNNKTVMLQLPLLKSSSFIYLVYRYLLSSHSLELFWLPKLFRCSLKFAHFSQPKGHCELKTICCYWFCFLFQARFLLRNF